MPLLVLCNYGELKNREQNDENNTANYSEDEISDLLGLSTKPSINSIKEMVQNDDGNESKVIFDNDDILQLIMDFVPGHYEDTLPLELKDREVKVVKINIDTWSGMNDALKWMIDLIDDKDLKQKKTPYSFAELQPSPLP